MLSGVSGAFDAEFGELGAGVVQPPAVEGGGVKATLRSHQMIMEGWMRGCGG